MSITGGTLDEAYRDAMLEHLAQIEEELREIEHALKSRPVSALIYRATERTIQLLIEACIGIAKQVLKLKGVQVPSDARQAFVKLRSLGRGITCKAATLGIDRAARRGLAFQKASPGTRTQPSISTRALRLIMALLTTQSLPCCVASAPTRSVPEG